MIRTTRTIVTLLPLLCCAPIAAHAQEVCADASDRAQVECLAGKTAEASQELDRVYAATLAKLPATDPSDIRKSRAQLVTAEEAWKKYVDQNCAFVGAASGGSNLWVTNFASRCTLQETNRRIDFFRSLSLQSG